MGTQRTEGRYGDKLSVLVVDDNPCDANTASYMLAKLDIQVMVFTSPIEALKYLKDHKEDIDFALVAVNMKEMRGFEFLDISRELHKNLQVIMMSDEITWPTMKRSVELGARFLIKKPFDAETLNEIWQHLDIRVRREKIEDLFQGIEGKRDDVFKSDNIFREGANKQKAAQLMWTPFLQKKFLQALELLGEAATPKMIHLIMNVDSIDRNQVSAHLQKHRKKIEKELCNSNAKKCSNGVSSSQPNTSQYDPEIQSVHTSDEDMSWDQTESTNEIQGKNNMIETMRRALRLGAVFDESQLPHDPSDKQASKGEVDMMEDVNYRDDWTHAFGDKNVVSETQNAENTKRAMGKCDSDEEVPNNGVAQGQVVKLVTYSDSEDGEAL